MVYRKLCNRIVLLVLCLFSALCWSWPPTEKELRAWCRNLQWELCEETQQLLAQQDKAVVRWLKQSIDSQRNTPLHILAQEGNLCLLQVWLLRSSSVYRVSIVAANYYGITPLHYAVKKGHLLIAQFLLAQGASIVAVNRYSDTLLHDAAWHGHLPIAQFLLAHGAPVMAINQYGETPLHFAAGNGHLAIAQLLLIHGASIEAINQYGDTSLHDAVGNGHLPIVQLLLADGASVTAVNDDNESPLSLATQLGHESIVQLLSNPPAPAFNSPSLQHLASFTVWHAVGRHVDRLRALFDGALQSR